MAQRIEDYYKFCPDQPEVLISDAVCFGRRRAHYPVCDGCRFNDDQTSPCSTEAGRAGLQQEARIKVMDAIFKAYDVRGVYPDQIDEQVAYRIGYATATFLRASLRGVDRGEPEAGRIVVGRDMRKSSPSISAAFMDGARHAGAPVVDIGMIDTSQIYFAVNHIRCAGGVQTTASHNPAQYNGFKISAAGGAPVGENTGLTDVKRIAQTVSPPSPKDREPAPLTEMDLSEPYKAFLRQFLEPPRPMKIAVDASNGMAGRWLPIIFGDVGALELSCLNMEHNGEFVHDPNPLVDANLDELRAEVKRIGADFGVCFDGDADRLMLVDEDARIVRCDMVTALLARAFLEREPGATIVYDLRSSRVVAEEIRAAGGRPRRERVGHAFMKKALAETKAVFGGELSGHFYFKDNYFCDSGMLALIHVINVLTRAGKPLGALIKPLKRYAASGERNFENAEKDATIQRLGEIYQDGQVDFLDGVTVQHDDWWFNVRKSNTEPLLRLNLEAKSEALMEEKIAEVAAHLGTPVDH